MKVLFTLSLDDALLRQVREVDQSIEVNVVDYRTLLGLEQEAPGDDAKALKSLVAESDVIYGFPPSTEDLQKLLPLMPRLRWFQAASAGVERLDLAALQQRGVITTTSSGVHATPIGEFVLMFMLMFAKRGHYLVRAQAEKRWARYPGGMGWGGRQSDELRGATVGVVGMGAIGGEVTRLAKAFGCRVIAVRRSASGRNSTTDVDELLPSSELPYLLAESDYIVLAVPLTKETERLIGGEELRLMKTTAVIINISRGSVIDESALVEALREERIGGAALDVFEKEPLPPESELWGMENVIISPHISGGSALYFQRAIPIFCENLRLFLDGKRLRNLVDPERGY